VADTLGVAAAAADAAADNADALVSVDGVALAVTGDAVPVPDGGAPSLPDAELVAVIVNDGVASGVPGVVGEKEMDDVVVSETVPVCELETVPLDVDDAGGVPDGVPVPAAVPLAVAPRVRVAVELAVPVGVSVADAVRVLLAVAAAEAVGVRELVADGTGAQASVSLRTRWLPKSTT
jgi:hypothetical protein